MQLPFVLNSAEVMKAAVAYLEPHMEKAEDAEPGGATGKGTIVLATVKGDVHDIGKNLVDIILTNNGYRVVNIGIKQPVAAIVGAAQEHDADLIGMSGLLVKSTVVMKENLEEINERGLAKKWPVLLGGAALTRAFVEEDLSSVYDGEVRYARDAFEGLRLMDAFMSVKRGEPGASLPELRGRKVARRDSGPRPEVEIPARSNVATDNEVPTPPFWGSRVVKGIPLADYAAYLDERALFLGQWGLKSSRGDGPDYKALVEVEGRPRLRMWLDRMHTEGLLGAAVVYGYFPCWSEGDELVVLDPTGLAEAGPKPLEHGWEPRELHRLAFPRQHRDRFLCLADYFRSMEAVLAEGRPDVVAFHVVTMGAPVSEAAARLFEANAYREYVELHGLGVQLTEALAEYWHARVRAELGIDAQDAADRVQLVTKQTYQGERYSFGYPACPDVEQQTVIVDLLDPARIGVELSEEFQLHPEQSTSALIVHHPEATYYNAG
jgi:5-methyltetrahydrofolate--homocysteine methyltransferase